MPIQLSENERRIVKKILNSFLPIDAKIYVFGSRVCTTCKPFSDLDLALDLGRCMTPQEEIALKDAFDASKLIFRVDVVDLHNITPSFKESIIDNFVKFDHQTDDLK